MLRFLSFLLGKPYEPCKSCETLKEQLAFANEEKRELTATLLSIIKPKVYESAPVELKPVVQTSGLFSRRRAVLEQRDRETARVLQDNKNIGRPDNLKEVPYKTGTTDIEQLENELGIDDSQKMKE